jgi:hypothetical protein
MDINSGQHDGAEEQEAREREARRDRSSTAKKKADGKGGGTVRYGTVRADTGWYGNTVLHGRCHGIFIAKHCSYWPGSIDLHSQR